MAAQYAVILCLISASAISTNAISQPIGTNNRVLPGQNAIIGIFPFMASISLFPDDTFLCAGAIISDTWILTSAECIYKYTSAVPSPVGVRVGGVQITVHEPGELLISAFRLLTHPDFKPAAGSNATRLDQNYYNNIGLIELMSPIIWSGSQIGFAEMAEAAEVITPGETVVLAGWGGITETTPVDNLQYSTNLHIMTNNDCYNAVPGTEFDRYHICTAPYPDATACKYDHGGPLFKFDGTRGTVLLGVVNYAPCWDTTHPTVFASVPAHRNWIFTTSGV